MCSRKRLELRFASKMAKFAGRNCFASLAAHKCRAIDEGELNKRQLAGQFFCYKVIKG